MKLKIIICVGLFAILWQSQALGFSLPFFKDSVFAKNTQKQASTQANPNKKFMRHDTRNKKKASKHSRHPSNTFAKQRDSTGKRVFIFDPRKTQWAAYNEQGRLIGAGRASGGKSYCADIGRGCLTPRGKFTMYHKRGAGCISSKFPLGKGGAPMPHCMFFHGGYAIHGSPDVPVGVNASHGCIRVLPAAAKWLSENFMTYRTTVIVKPY